MENSNTTLILLLKINSYKPLRIQRLGSITKVRMLHLTNSAQNFKTSKLLVNQLKRVTNSEMSLMTGLESLTSTSKKLVRGWVQLLISQMTKEIELLKRFKSLNPGAQRLEQPLKALLNLLIFLTLQPKLKINLPMLSLYVTPSSILHHQRRRRRRKRKRRRKRRKMIRKMLR